MEGNQVRSNTGAGATRAEALCCHSEAILAAGEVECEGQLITRGEQERGEAEWSR